MKSLRTYFSAHSRAVFAAGGALLLVSAVLSVCLGAADVSLGTLWRVLTGAERDTAQARIILFARLPRTAGCLLAGAALAASGCMIQSVLANPLAAPHIIGVNAGAGLAVTICCCTGAVAGWTMTAAAFAGAMAAVLVVVILARRTGASRMTVALGGVAVSSVLNAASEALVKIFPDAMAGSVDFRLGGFSAVSETRLIPAGILILLALAAAFTMSHELDLLSLGEDTARSLGMRVRATRTGLLAIAALLAGAAVSFAGSLGFVGLIVPHMARGLTRGGSGRILPLSALLGGSLVTLCDVAGRLIFDPYEMPVGILLSFIGAPAFIWLLLRQRGGRVHD